MISKKAARQKGKDLENYISDQIIAKGLDDGSNRDGASGAGNREKRDVNTSVIILGRTMGIEAKNHSVAKMQDWWRQTVELEKLGYEPVLIYKLFGESMGEAKAVIRLDTLLELIKHQSDTEIQTGVARSDKWILQGAVEALKKAIKVLEKFID